jgi:uncharacterized membrane protein
MKVFIYVTSFILMTMFLPLQHLDAQELIQDKTEILKAKVVEVISQKEEDVANTGISSISQTISVEILQGEQKGKILTIENDYIALEKGDNFFLYHSIDALDGRESYAVRDIDRRPVIFFFIVLFILVVLFFSGRQGVRSLLGLGGSFLVISVSLRLIFSLSTL